MQEQDKLNAIVEDRFVVLKAAELFDTLPEGETLEMIATAIESSAYQHQVLLDYYGVEPWLNGDGFPNDAKDFTTQMSNLGAQILCESDHVKDLSKIFNLKHKPLVLEKGLSGQEFQEVNEHKNILTEDSSLELDQSNINPDLVRKQISILKNKKKLNQFQISYLEDLQILDEMFRLGHQHQAPSWYFGQRESFLAGKYHQETGELPYTRFVDSYSYLNLHRKVLNLDMEVLDMQAYGDVDRTEKFDSWLKAKRIRSLNSNELTLDNTYRSQRIIHELLGFARNSLLVQYVVAAGGGTVSITPFHAGGYYNVEQKNDILRARPLVKADAIQGQKPAILSQFEELLATYQRETDITIFLRKHPEFIESLGIVDIRHEVVLEIGDGKSLRPDFLVQKAGETLWDILEVKRPDEALVVGGENRQGFAAKVHYMMNQLREYEEYFNDPVNIGRVREKYGINVYKPRLIGLIGRTGDVSAEDLRKYESAYKNMQLLTFDHMLAAASRQMLV